ncbi:MAG: M23 family metallopeptidase, partial [Bacteroidia bacterium]
NYFTSPMFLPFNLAGNFGEIRANHFHSGIDIKTNEQEGQVVLAAADGYISRIKVSAVGFGNAIYINHPNGYTTVYGHLQRFNDSIKFYVEAEQYKKESFEVDLSLDSNLFPVKQGQLIALSGNTGGSEGPHLHFEIRDKVSEHPINPFLCGFHLEDTISPVAENIKVYQFHQNSFGWVPDTEIVISGSPAVQDTIYIFEKAAISVNAFDKMNDTTNRLVVNFLEILLNEETLYTYRFDEFSFDESRFVNANIDYAEKINEKKKYILLYRLPGNNFSMFGKDTTMTGIIDLKDELFHEVQIRVADLNGNGFVKKIVFRKMKDGRWNSELERKKMEEKKMFDAKNFISWKKTPVINKPDIKISFAEHAVYNLSPLVIIKEKKIKRTYSPLFSVGNETIPIHTFMNLSLKPVNLPTALFAKALIVSVDKKENKYAEESSYTNGWVTGKIRHFGKFTIAIDTIAPEIKEPAVYSDSISGKRILFTIISDNLSGIKAYRVTINGKWFLMDYDEKTGRLIGEWNKTFEGVKSELEIEVTDRKENRKAFKTIIDL